MAAAALPQPPWITGSWSTTVWEEDTWGDSPGGGAANIGSRYRSGYRWNYVSSLLATLVG